MTLPFFKSELHWHAEDRQGRLRRVLDRARVQYSPSCPESALDSLPIVNRAARLPHPGAQKFHFPLAMPARVAILESEFSAHDALRQFAAHDTLELKQYMPEALVLRLPLALTLADQKLRNLLDLPTLTRAIVLLTSPDMAFEDHHRTLLWKAFGIPQFEQFCAWDGTVVARECEVHDGLHIDPAAVIFQKDGDELVVTQLTQSEVPILRVRSGLTATIVTEHCECGAETPRLRNLASLHTKARLAVA